MSGARRSRTAQGVAAERAALTAMGVVHDPVAHRMLTPPWKGFVGVVRHRPFATGPGSVARTGLAARTLWHDARVADAFDAGIEQIAIVGAGYDTRAWRLRCVGVRYFELDHGVTQRDKKRRAPAAGPVYVAADLSVDDAATALHRGGLDPTRSALFILEGVTMYLTEEVARRQLSELARSSAPGSRLSVDFSPSPDAGTARDRRLMQLQRLFRTGSGEILRLVVDRAGAVDLVATSGWQVTASATMRDAARTLISRESGLPVDAVSVHKTLVAAARS